MHCLCCNPATSFLTQESLLHPLALSFFQRLKEEHRRMLSQKATSPKKAVPSAASHHAAPKAASPHTVSPQISAGNTKERPGTAGSDVSLFTSLLPMASFSFSSDAVALASVGD